MRMGMEMLGHSHGGGHSGRTNASHQTPKAYSRGEVPTEARAANTFVKFFDSVSFDIDAFTYFVTRQRDDIQVRMFKFVIGILNEWSDCYVNDGVTKGTEMYRICKWANKVLTTK